MERNNVQLNDVWTGARMLTIRLFGRSSLLRTGRKFHRIVNRDGRPVCFVSITSGSIFRTKSGARIGSVLADDYGLSCFL